MEEMDGEEKALRYRKTAAAPVAERAPATAAPEKSEHREFPAWLREQAPAQAPRTAPLSPSSAFDEDIGHMAPAGASPADRQRALDRGRIVHRLMQSLPDIPSARHKDAAAIYLAKAATDFSPAEQTEIAQQVFTILNDLRFDEVFRAGSRAEVPIVGRIARANADPLLVAGQVDRLTVTADAVLLADYKTDRVVPHALDEIKPYVTQLALYRALLSRIYPDKNVRAALLFINGPALLEVPAAAMDAALEAELGKVLTKPCHAAVKVP
jgi:ATP-dependent helicase/nuclease subunit A